MPETFKVGLKASQAHDLINKLASDDRFRAQFENDPKGTLARLNVTLPDSVFAGNFKLPPKADFQRMVGDLRLAPGRPAAAEVVFLAFFAFFKK